MSYSQTKTSPDPDLKSHLLQTMQKGDQNNAAAELQIAATRLDQTPGDSAQPPMRAGLPHTSGHAKERPSTKNIEERTHFELTHNRL